jgi:hypothetical protein
MAEDTAAGAPEVGPTESASPILGSDASGVPS